MRIERYTFGEIVISGKRYTSDLILYPDRIDSSWWRAEGHRLQLQDLTEALAARPEVLIVGCGQAGVMTVPEDVRQAVRSRGVELIVERTGKAVERYNALGAARTVVAALHLTC